MERPDSLTVVKWLILAFFSTILLVSMSMAINTYLLFSEIDAAMAVPNEYLTGKESTHKISVILSGSQSTAGIKVNDAAFFWEGGNFNGTNAFWVYQCRSADDCWKSILTEGPLPRKDIRWCKLTRDEFHSFEYPTINILKDGPWDKTMTNRWDVNKIKNGVSCLQKDKDRRLFYVAIDFDNNTVYGSYQSGGY